MRELEGCVPRSPLHGRANCLAGRVTLRPQSGPRHTAGGPCQDGVLRTMSHVPLPHPAGLSPACTCAAVAPTARGSEPNGAAGRLGPTHALILLIAFLGLGCSLFLAGTELQTVFALLGGCGAIGAATLTAAGGGRRLMTVLVEMAVRSGAGK